MKRFTALTIAIMLTLALTLPVAAQNTGRAAPNQPNWRLVQHQQAMAARRGRIGGR